MKKNIAQKYLLLDIDKASQELMDLESQINTSNQKTIEKKHEIQAIKNDLNKIKSQVLRNNLPDKDDRFVQYDIFITYSWGIKHPLGRKLLDISTKYMNL